MIGDEVPVWARRWCGQSAREVHRYRVPGHPAEPTSANRISAIADLTTRAARRGSTVLVLPVLQQARGEPPRVVAAVRHLPDDVQALAEAAACAGCMAADLVVAHGLPASFGERSIGLDGAVQDAGRLLDAAVRAAVSSVPGLRVQPWLARVRPHELVGEQLDADLLVLGGPRADRWGQLGLVARSALFHAPCPVLLTARPTRSAPEPWSPTGEEPKPSRVTGDRP